MRRGQLRPLSQSEREGGQKRKEENCSFTKKTTGNFSIVSAFLNDAAAPPKPTAPHAGRVTMHAPSHRSNASIAKPIAKVDYDH